MDKKLDKARVKGRPPKKLKDSSATTVKQDTATPNNIVTTDTHDDNLAKYLLSTHEHGYYVQDTAKNWTSHVRGKRPLSTSPVPLNKRYRLVNVNEQAVEEGMVPFGCYVPLQKDAISSTMYKSSIPLLTKSLDTHRLTASPDDIKPMLYIGPDSHKRLSPQISFPPHLERQSPHTNRIDVRSSPSRLSPYYDYRSSPDMLNAEMQSLVNRATPIDLSPAGMNALSPARDRPSISPFKAHLLQAVPESERHSPARYASTPDRNVIKTISPIPRTVSPAQMIDRYKGSEQKTLVRMLKDGSNLVPVTIMSGVGHSGAYLYGGINAPSPAKLVLSTNEKPSLLREHLTAAQPRAEHASHEAIMNTNDKTIVISRNNHNLDSTIPEVTITEVNATIKRSTVSSFAEEQLQPPVLSLNLPHTPIAVSIHPPELPIRYAGGSFPSNYDPLGRSLLPDSVRVKLEPPANLFFQNVGSLDKNSSNDSEHPADSGVKQTHSKRLMKTRKKGGTVNAVLVNSRDNSDEKAAEEKAKIEHVEMTCPFNRRKNILSKFNNTNSSFRSKSQSLAMHRIRYGCTSSAVKSLDVLRRNLQKSLNERIADVVKCYVDKFFKPAIENIKFNNGDNSVSEEHIQVISRQILEEAKKMYDENRRSVSPCRDTWDTQSEAGSCSGSGRKLHNGISRVKLSRPSDSDSELSVPVKRKKGRPPLHFSSGRSTPSKTFKQGDNVRREGPKWHPDRLTTDTKFVMGARANKALGLGATRGRLYIKHPDIFKYSGDQEDKQWLYDNRYMPAAGGKAYLLVVEDIQELSESEEYRNSSLLMMNEVVSFTVPDFMIHKMKAQMLSLCTSDPRKGTTVINQTETETIIPGLPFTNFIEEDEPKIRKDTQLSPANTEDLDLLSSGDHGDHTPMSPFTMTGGFDDVNSPAPSDFETLGDDHPLSAPFDLTK